MDKVSKVTCPVCNGSGRAPCPDNRREYGQKYGWYGYQSENDTVDCYNCGGQYPYVGKPTGKVRVNKAGDPCVHKYVGKSVGRCLTRYVCEECGDMYDIDSSD